MPDEHEHVATCTCRDEPRQQRQGDVSVNSVWKILILTFMSKLAITKTFPFQRQKREVSTNGEVFTNFYLKIRPCM